MTANNIHVGEDHHVIRTICIGFGLLIFLVLLLAGSAIFHIHKNQQYLNDLVTQTNTKIRLTQKIREAVILRTKRFYAAIIQQDAFDRDDEMQLFAIHARSFIENKALLKQQNLTRVEAQLLQAVSDQASQSQPLVDYVMELLIDEFSQDEITELIKQSELLQVKVIAKIIALSDLIQQNAQDALQISRQKSAGTQKILMLLTFLLVFLGIAIAIFVMLKVKDQHKQIVYQASHDSLTGLMNRRVFEEKLQLAMQKQPKDSDKQHALYYLDLDQFKIVNDTYGHHVGDKLLEQLTHFIAEKLHGKAYFSRLGGDEFGVLQLNAGKRDIQEMAKELLEMVRSFHFIWEEQVFHVGVSIGIYSIDKQNLSASSAMSAADASCYLAKDEGRNRVHYFQPDDIDITKRLLDIGWIRRINQALEENHFKLYCQKILALDPLVKETHYEILLRLTDHDQNVLSPCHFLPPAERFGLMPSIDKWVVEKTIDWLEAYGLNHHSTEYFSINLSGNSLDDQDLLDFMYQRLSNASFPANHITFEITETIAINNIQRALEFIYKLNELGCRFSLDDFGSGLSSFGYLKQLPVNYLKIDGIFVKNCTKDPVDLALVHSIHEVGQIMNMETIAEFVEDEETLNLLKSLGINFAQGYHIGKPVPIDQLHRRH